MDHIDKDQGQEEIMISKVTVILVFSFLSHRVGTTAYAPRQPHLLGSLDYLISQDDDLVSITTLLDREKV